MPLSKAADYIGAVGAALCAPTARIVLFAHESPSPAVADLSSAKVIHIAALPLLVHEPFPLLSPDFPCLRVDSKVQSRTDTLEIGSRAPEFSLGAANREGVFTLTGFLEHGPLILEFLRGTW